MTNTYTNTTSTTPIIFILHYNIDYIPRIMRKNNVFKFRLKKRCIITHNHNFGFRRTVDMSFHFNFVIFFWFIIFIIIINRVNFLYAETKKTQACTFLQWKATTVFLIYKNFTPPSLALLKSFNTRNLFWRIAETFIDGPCPFSLNCWQKAASFSNFAANKELKKRVCYCFASIESFPFVHKNRYCFPWVVSSFFIFVALIFNIVFLLLFLFLFFFYRFIWLFVHTEIILFSRL